MEIPTGPLPGTITTIVLNGIVQAQHIDSEFYDAHYQQGAYLQTHAEHMDTWHGGDLVAGPSGGPEPVHMTQLRRPADGRSDFST